jgi:alkanesulfonate monooxygenase
MKPATRFHINIMPANDRREDRAAIESFLQAVKQTDANYFRYSLVTVGDTRQDPWVLAQKAMETKKDFAPLIAVNPFYQHPIVVAKKLISLQSLYDNPMALNLVSGSFFHEMQRLGDDLDFPARNRRLIEFHEALSVLLSGSASCSYQGDFFSFQDVQIFPKANKNKIDIFMSGSLPDELKPRDESVYYVKNVRPLEPLPPAAAHQGLSFGICARPSRELAQQALQQLFPDDRKGRMLYEMAAANTQTPWNQWLQKEKDLEQKSQGFFSLKPARNFWTSAPYMVGSYQEIAREIKKYLSLGYAFFLLDYHPQDAGHVHECLKLTDF